MSTQLQPSKSLIIAARGAGFIPWDGYDIIGVGNPNNEGLFQNYTLKIWPGSVAGIIPAEMFNTFSVVGNNLTYFVVTTKINNGSPSTVSIQSTTNPSIKVQTETANGVPPEFKVIVSAFYKGKYYNIRRSNIIPRPTVSKVVDKSSSSPFGLAYIPYYIWTEI